MLLSETSAWLDTTGCKWENVLWDEWTKPFSVCAIVKGDDVYRWLYFPIMICKILERQAARCRRFPCSCPSRKTNPGWLSLGASCRLEKQWDVWVFNLWTDREWAAIWPKSHHSPKSLLLYSLTRINSHNSSGGLVSPVKMATFPHNTCMNNSALWALSEAVRNVSRLEVPLAAPRGCCLYTLWWG